jgi:surfactin synthase thioesterase subunit
MAQALEYESLLVRRAPNANARLRLFCIPYAGTGASIFARWPAMCSSALEIAAIQLPGREDRAFEQPFTRMGLMVKTIAQAMRPYLGMPFALFGHSSGALIAFELARELRTAFESLPSRLFLSSHPAAHLVVDREDFGELSETDLIEALRRFGGTSDQVLANAEMLRMIMPAVRADFAVCARYTYRPSEPLSCPITAFVGKDDERVRGADLMAWRRETSGAFDLQVFAGGHFFINEQPRPVLQAIARTCLEERPAVIDAGEFDGGH